MINFMPSNALIVTWDSVAPYSSSISGFASFQAILSTDGSHSFVTINYGTLDFRATYGYYFQFEYTQVIISRTNPEFSSNVGVNGKWIYHLSNFILLLLLIKNNLKKTYLLFLKAQTPYVISTTTTSTKTTSTSTLSPTESSTLTTSGI